MACRRSFCWKVRNIFFRHLFFLGSILYLLCFLFFSGCTPPPDITKNQMPIAYAGEDQSVHVGQDIQLDGSQSYDLEENFLTFRWAQLRGPRLVPLEGSNAPIASFVAIAEGTYVFLLTVSDGRSTGHDTVEVHVEAINPQPPAPTPFDPGARVSVPRVAPANYTPFQYSLTVMFLCPTDSSDGNHNAQGDRVQGGDGSKPDDTSDLLSIGNHQNAAIRTPGALCV